MLLQVELVKLVGCDGLYIVVGSGSIGEVAEVGCLLAGLLKVVLQLVEVVVETGGDSGVRIEFGGSDVLAEMLAKSCKVGSRGLLSGGGRRRGKKVGVWRGWLRRWRREAVGGSISLRRW